MEPEECLETGVGSKDRLRLYEQARTDQLKCVVELQKFLLTRVEQLNEIKLTDLPYAAAALPHIASVLQTVASMKIVR